MTIDFLKKDIVRSEGNKMDREDMIFELLQGVDRKVDSHGNSLVRVEADLKYHIKRTDLLENQLRVIETDIDDVNNSIQTRLPKPSLTQIKILIGILASIIGIGVSLKWL